MSIFQDRFKDIAGDRETTTRQRLSTLTQTPKIERYNKEESDKRFEEYMKQFNSALVQDKMRQMIEGSDQQKPPTYEEAMATRNGTQSFTARRNPILEFRSQRLATQQSQRIFAERFLGMPAEDKNKATETLLGLIEDELKMAPARLFFGRGEARGVAGEGLSIGQIAAEGGAVGLLYGTILKSNDEKKAERYQELLRIGIEPQRALEVANSYEGDGEKPMNLTEDERKAMRSYSLWRGAFIGLELADLLLLGKPINTALKVMTKGSKHALFTAVATAENAATARRIIASMHPELVGKDGLEEMITLARGSSKYDSWSKTLADTEAAQKLLDQAPTAPMSSPTTVAQEVFYQGGVPVVRNARDTARTVTRTASGRNVQDSTTEALAIRQEINSALEGVLESSRLSNPTVFMDEVKAGAFPFKQEIGSPVRMFVSDEVADASRLLPGERLATTKEVMESVADAGKVKMLEVMPDDLIRLADGTFTYAPKEQVGKGVQATLRNLREGQRVKVAEIERSREMSQLYKQIVQENQIFEATIAKRERAAQVAVRRAEEVRKARALAETGEANLKTRIEGLRTERATELSKVRENAKANRVQVQEGERTMRTLLSNLRKNDKATARVSTTARKQIDRIRSLKRATPAEKKKLIEKARKSRDRELVRLKKEKEVIRTKAKRATEALAKVRNEMPDVARETARINKQYKDLITSDKVDTLSAVAKAKNLVRTAEGQKQKVVAQKAKVQSEKTTTEYTNIMKDNFSSVRAEVKEVTSFGTASPVQPLAGSASSKVVENQIIKELTEELDMAYKAVGIDDPAKATAEQLQRVPFTHRVVTNPEQIRSAVQKVGSDPEAAYYDLISGNITANDTVAALGMVLLKTDFLRGNAIRLANVERVLVKTATGLGQQLQSFQVFSRLDYTNLVGKMMRQNDELMKKRGINIQAETAKLEKALGDEFDRLMVISKADAVEQLTKITCKV